MATFGAKLGSSDVLSRQVGLDSSNGKDPMTTALENFTKLQQRLGKESAKEIAAYKETLAKQERERDEKELKRVQREIWEANATASEKFVDSLKGTLVKGLQNVANSAFNSISSYLNIFSQNIGTMSSRLQGGQKTYTTMMTDIANKLSTSPYFKQTDMISNLNKFIESGVNYNLELRSYVATATDKIASTFNAFDSSLLRLIRIQQEDTTVARLGMEATLTRFLNSRYNDTSYLTTGGVSDNVSSLLTEASSLMGGKGATEFEYVVQKWLGSMSSLGVSDATISSIATGLGYLGSGNISALSSNTALQNLLVMAASNAGLDYGSLLTNGVSATSANSLLASIVGIGQNAATSSSNVVRSQYANLFGVNVSDLVSLTNITAQDLKAISENMLSYEGMRKEVSNQMNNLSSRTSPTEIMATVLSNYMTGTASRIAENPAMYAMWSIAEMMSSSGLDPTFQVAPFGVGVETSLSSMMKLGITGQSALVNLIPAIVNAANGNILGNQLTSWGGTEYNRKGSGFTPISGVATSASSYIGTIDASSVSGAFQETKESASTYVGDESSTSSDISENVKSIRYDVSDLLTELKGISRELSLGRISW